MIFFGNMVLNSLPILLGTLGTFVITHVSNVYRVGSHVFALELMQSNWRVLVQGDKNSWYHQVKTVNVSPLMVFTQESREMCRGHGGNL